MIHEARLLRRSALIPYKEAVADGEIVLAVFAGMGYETDSFGAKDMRILSWNIKHFTSIVTYHGNAYEVLRQVMNTFDLISIYEVPNSANGNTAVATLINGTPAPAARNGLPPTVPGLVDVSGLNYNSFLEPSNGLGKENDQVAIIWNTATCTVANTTAARRGSNNYGGGREPVYYNVTETASGNTKEFVSWHAPSPDGEASACIAQTWQQLLSDAMNGPNKLTTLMMGDFNSMPTATGGRQTQATKRLRGSSSNFKAMIAGGSPNGTTLKTTFPPNATPVDCRTNVTYDQFYLDDTLVANQPAPVAGIYDIIRRLANDEAPLTRLFGRQYNTAQKAYTLYYGSISDHLPVGLIVTL